MGVKDETAARVAFRGAASPRGLGAPRGRGGQERSPTKEEPVSSPIDCALGTTADAEAPSGAGTLIALAKRLRTQLDELLGRAEATWSITTTADNASATATRAGESGKSHYITQVSGSFSAAATKLLTLSDGGTVIANLHVVNQRDIALARPLKLTAGQAAAVTLAASGAAGVVGAVTLSGFTR